VEDEEEKAGGRRNCEDREGRGVEVGDNVSVRVAKNNCFNGGANRNNLNSLNGSVIKRRPDVCLNLVRNGLLI